MTAIREGAWLCPFCGSVCRGRDMRCGGEDGGSGCGVGRPDGVRFFLPRDAQAVRAAWLLERARAGVAWTCDHCRSENDGDRTSCQHCGQALDEADTRRTTILHQGRAPATAAAAAARATRKESRIEGKQAASPSHQASNRKRSSGRGHRILMTLAGLIGLGGMAALLWAVLSTEPVMGQVERLDWTRSIAVEHHATVEREGWTVPQDAVVLGSETRQRGTQEIIVGYTDPVPAGGVCAQRDLGNGFFEDVPCPAIPARPITREEPVEAPWYLWQEKAWVHHRHATASGAYPEAPSWPVLSLRPDERESSRQATYTLTAHPDATQGHHKTSVTISIAEHLWRSLEPGGPVVLHRNRLGQIVSAGRTP